MKTNEWFVPAVGLCCVLMAGCQQFNADTQVFDRYYMTTLRLSTSADVLTLIQKEEKELLSQSKNVVASWGQKKDMATLWFNMVAFDQEQNTAVRKYGFAVDEKASGLVTPYQKLRFDAQIVIPADILGKPYADQNQMRIEVLKYIHSSFKKDAGELTLDSAALQSATLLINQTFTGMFNQLDRSPSLAVKLADYTGMDFDHINLGPAKIRMLIENDIAKVKIKVGRDWFNQQKFEKHPDVIHM